MRFRGTAAIVVCSLAAACGDSDTDRLRAAAVAEAAPVVEAFAADLEGGRVDAALARTTRAFQGAAKRDAIAAVLDSQRRALGTVRTRSVREAESVAGEGEPPRLREALLVLDGTFERGPAVIRARVVRDASRGGFLVDGYEVRNDLFTWTYR